MVAASLGTVSGTVSAAANGHAGPRAVNARPGGIVEYCERPSGLREFESRWSLVVGPLAIRGAGVELPYAENVGGNSFSFTSWRATA